MAKKPVKKKAAKPAPKSKKPASKPVKKAAAKKPAPAKKKPATKKPVKAAKKVNTAKSTAKKVAPTKKPVAKKAVAKPKTASKVKPGPKPLAKAPAKLPAKSKKAAEVKPVAKTQPKATPASKEKVVKPTVQTPVAIPSNKTVKKVETPAVKPVIDSKPKPAPTSAPAKKPITKPLREESTIDDDEQEPTPVAATPQRSSSEPQVIDRSGFLTRTKFSDSELNEFRELIKKKLELAHKDYELLKDTLSQRDNNGTDDTSPTFKLLEDGSEVMSKEETTQLALRQQKYIESLENALIRIENKTYGICRATGKMISKERLRSVPHATLSIEAKLRQSS